MWASSCNWISLLSSSSLALSASSRSCFSLCRCCLSTWAAQTVAVRAKKRGFGGRIREEMWTINNGEKSQSRCTRWTARHKKGEKKSKIYSEEMQWLLGSNKTVSLKLRVFVEICLDCIDVDMLNQIPSPLVFYAHYLFSGPLLSGLGLHLLHFKWVHPPAAPKQVMVPYTQLEDLQRGNKSNNRGVEPLATASKVFLPLHLQTRPK